MLAFSRGLLYNSLGDFMKKMFNHSLKLFFSLIFSCVASFIIAISFAVILSSVSIWVFYALTQLFNLIILVTVIWQRVYDLGFRDSNMVRTGHMAEDLYKGFKIGAIAQIPWLLFLIASVIFNLRFSIYRIFNSAYYWLVTAIAGTFNGKELATITMGNIGVFKIILFAFVLLIVPAISGGVYILGYKGIDIFSKFVYKKSKGK